MKRLFGLITRDECTLLVGNTNFPTKLFDSLDTRDCFLVVSVRPVAKPLTDFLTGILEWLFLTFFIVLPVTNVFLVTDLFTMFFVARFVLGILLWIRVSGVTEVFGTDVSLLSFSL